MNYMYMYKIFSSPAPSTQFGNPLLCFNLGEYIMCIPKFQKLTLKKMIPHEVKKIFLYLPLF